MNQIVPDKLTFQYCFDGVHFPKLFDPVICIMRVRDGKGRLKGAYTICTPVADPESPSEKFWIQHNSVQRERVYPYAYLVTSAEANVEFLEAIQKFKTLSYNLKTPYQYLLSAIPMVQKLFASASCGIQLFLIPFHVPAASPV